MKKLAILFAVAASAFGQAPGTMPPAPLAPGESVGVVEIKQGNPETIYNALRTVFPGVSITGHTIVVRGSEAAVKTIEEAVKKLDVPAAPSPQSQSAPNVELTVQMILASQQESPDAKLPADLEATVRQLRSLFQYKSYRLIDTELLRGRAEPNNRFDVNGLIPGSANTFQFSAQAAVLNGPAPRNIRLSNANFGFRFQVNGPFQTAGITGNFDIREGQKTVLGKSNLVNSEDAIILVITPKIIE